MRLPTSAPNDPAQWTDAEWAMTLEESLQRLEALTCRQRAADVARKAPHLRLVSTSVSRPEPDLAPNRAGDHSAAGGELAGTRRAGAATSAGPGALRGALNEGAELGHRAALPDNFRDNSQMPIGQK